MNVYHYTVGSKLAAISKSGALRPTAKNIGWRERPMLWFSRHPHFEQTARKFLGRLGGEVKLATFHELNDFVGVYRFVLPVADKRLVHWPNIPTAARIAPAAAMHMIRQGVEWGAVPADWYGTFERVPLYEMGFESWARGAGWTPTSLDTAIETTPANQHRIISAVAV